MAAPIPTVSVEPSGVAFPVADGENVFAAALRAGLRWPTVCFGQARCTACAADLVDGRGNVEPPTELELTALGQLGSRHGRGRRDVRDVRLACQLRVTGDVVLRKPGVKHGTADLT